MKIQFASDLHLELLHPAGEILAPTDTDVLILAGDIDTGDRGVRWLADQVAGRPVKAIYVPGNHEFYDQEHGEALHRMRTAGAQLGVAVLDNDEHIFQGVRFLGATLWTGFDAHGIENREIAMRMAEFGDGILGGRMADYDRIRWDDRGLRAADTLALYLASVAWLWERLETPYAGPTVVITHHAPAEVAVPLKDRDSSLGPAYWSPLEELMALADVWICGHTHLTVDSTINGCLLLSNPRGYPSRGGPQVGSYRPDWTIDL